MQAVGAADAPVHVHALRDDAKRGQGAAVQPGERLGVGLGADVVSGGEIRRARAAGISANKIVFSGVGKTEEEMRLALQEGVFQFNLESVAEADALSAVATSMGRTAPIAFRVNPDVAADTHAKITTGTYENKFGIAFEQVEGVYARASKLKNLRLRGIQIPSLVGVHAQTVERLRVCRCETDDLQPQRLGLLPLRRRGGAPGCRHQRGDLLPGVLLVHCHRRIRM